jgi:hypothetical protein
MESSLAVTNESNNETQPDIKGNGNLKRKRGADGSSDDENDFLGFDLGEKANEIQKLIHL